MNERNDLYYIFQGGVENLTNPDEDSYYFMTQNPQEKNNELENKTNEK